MPDAKNIYAAPRLVTDIAECFFYHTIDVPGVGTINGRYDLREGATAYLGGVDLKGKRVLEVGSANGFLTFYMEKQGADVVSYDLSDEYDWDIVPYALDDVRQTESQRRHHIRAINNAYWFCHRAYQSNARVVYGTVYQIPEEIGEVDVATFGSVLLHVRDPFLALQKASRLTREMIIITDLFYDGRMGGPTVPMAGGRERLVRRIFGEPNKPFMIFQPDFRTGEPKETWWYLAPEVTQEFLGVLGFEETEITFHSQKYLINDTNVQIPMYTVVGRRTRTLS